MYRELTLVLDFNIIIVRKPLHLPKSFTTPFPEMYITAAYIVECLTNNTVQEFVTEKIFKPLGMDASTYSFDETMVGKGLADGFVAVETGHPEGEGRNKVIYKPIPYFDSHGNTSIIAGAGGVISNVKDVVSLFKTSVILICHSDRKLEQDTMVADFTPHGTSSRHQRADYPRSGNCKSSGRCICAYSTSSRSFIEPDSIRSRSDKLFVPRTLCTYGMALSRVPR